MHAAMRNEKSMCVMYDMHTSFGWENTLYRIFKYVHPFKTRAIQQQSLSSGHYWQFYELCSETMKEDYLKQNTLPEKYVASNAIKIQQINPTTKEIVNTFNSKREVILECKCSNLSLNKALENNSVMNGFLWSKS